MKDAKMVAQKNIQIMKACCIIVVNKLSVVLQCGLQTISSVLSSDGHWNQYVLVSSTSEACT